MSLRLRKQIYFNVSLLTSKMQLNISLRGYDFTKTAWYGRNMVNCKEMSKKNATYYSWDYWTNIYIKGPTTKNGVERLRADKIRLGPFSFPPEKFYKIFDSCNLAKLGLRSTKRLLIPKVIKAQHDNNNKYGCFCFYSQWPILIITIMTHQLLNSSNSNSSLNRFRWVRFVI